MSALCGEDPPTVIDGYGKWTVIDRPLRQGVTVPQGFNPAKVKISIRMGIWDGRFNFTGWDQSDDAGVEIESNIDDLHWMAGGNALGGPSPVVYVDTYNADGSGSNDLMPRQYRGAAWVIDGGIQWGKSYRNGHAYRTYQEAEFNLLGYNSFGVAPPKHNRQQNGGRFKTTQAVHTALAIASAPSSNSPAAYHEILAGRICHDPHNNPCYKSKIKLERRSLTWPMPIGLEVWVPSHVA
jgi:hypothetical protein